MRGLFAASTIAAALVLFPVAAKLQPLPPAPEADVVSAQGVVEQAQSSFDAIKAALSAWFSGSEDTGNTAKPNSPDAICATLDRSAAQNALPVDFFTRLIWQESRFNPFSVSHAGAQGIAQFMPGTARRVGLADPFDPIQALPKSAELLRELRAHFGNLGLAAAAYNAGPKRVEDWLGKRKVLPQETEAYVRIITGRSAQEWTSPEAAGWGIVVPVPGPCPQLAKGVPDRARPIVVAKHPERPGNRIRDHIQVAQRTSRAVLIAQRETVRCCHSAASSERAARSQSEVADRESIRCCKAPARNVKLARLESAQPKSIIAAPPKSAPRAHQRSASSEPASAESPRPLRHEPRLVSPRKGAPATRSARVA